VADLIHRLEGAVFVAALALALVAAILAIPGGRNALGGGFIAQRIDS
jgi:hypothetical protein